MREPAEEQPQTRRKVLVNLGSGAKNLSRLPAMFAEWREFRVDVDPSAMPDLVADITDMLAREDADTAELLGSGRNQSRGKAPVPGGLKGKVGEKAKELAGGLPSSDLADLIQQLTDQMHNAAAELQFEVAARYRDEISDLKKELRQMVNAGAK